MHDVAGVGAMVVRVMLLVSPCSCKFHPVLDAVEQQPNPYFVPQVYTDNMPEVVLIFKHAETYAASTHEGMNRARLHAVFFFK
jgi:hypothetical protein